jgi:hypothetical protein
MIHMVQLRIDKVNIYVVIDEFFILFLTKVGVDAMSYFIDEIDTVLVPQLTLDHHKFVRRYIMGEE